MGKNEQGAQKGLPRLLEERHRRHWSQRELAERIGTTFLTVSRWERGIMFPSSYYRQQLCEIFGKNAAELGLVPGEVVDERSEVRQNDIKSSDHDSLEQETGLEFLTSSSIKRNLLEEEAEHTTSREKVFRHHNHSSALPRLMPSFTFQKDMNRHRMLVKVRTVWINGILKNSLPQEAQLSLEMQLTPDGVINPWGMVVQAESVTPHLYPANTPIATVYDESGGELLILGEPGAGKTTVLLELVKDLLDRAEQDEHHPVPVVFNLSSWANKRASLDQWLVEELVDRYQVPRKLATSWAEKNQILPLLDGLDEVAADCRAACVEVINAYTYMHGLFPLVVCSRSVDYFQQKQRLLLRTAVTIQPLNAEQIERYLSALGSRTVTLQEALAQNSILQDLVMTPLLLTVFMVAYEGIAVEEGSTKLFLEKRREAIFTAYIQRVLYRRSPSANYKQEQTLSRLQWLAQRMLQHNQTVFYLEQMQCDWLPEGRWRSMYDIFAFRLPLILIGMLLCWSTTTALLNIDMSSLIYNMLPIIIGGLSGYWFGRRRKGKPVGTKREEKRIRVKWMYRENTSLLYGICIGGSVSFLCLLVLQLIQSRSYEGILFGLSCGITASLLHAIGKKRTIELAEKVTWSWNSFFSALVRGTHVRISLLVAGLIGLIVCLDHAYLNAIIATIFNASVTAVLAASFYWLALGFFYGFSSQMLDERQRVQPGHGVRSSLQNGMYIGLISIFVICSIYLMTSLSLTALIVPFTLFSPNFPLLIIMLGSFCVGMGSGLVIGLMTGGLAFWQHQVLRFLLWRAGVLPWKYTLFLDYAADRLLLRKVGGGYMFVHRMLLDHFVSLDVELFGGSHMVGGY